MPETVKAILTELAALGSDNIKKILLKHGVKEPFFGVKVEQLKPIQKRIKKDYKLANDLFLTGNADAMYLAGLIADDEQMTREDLQAWVKIAESTNISEYTVPWVAGGSRYGIELGMEWIDAAEEHIAAAGWATLSGLAALKPDSELDLPAYKKLLARVEQNIHASPNRVRSAMNGFIIAVGTYIQELTDIALATAERVGPVTVIKEGTACKVPPAREYIDKAVAKGVIGKKKKMLKC
jgi:3-methyladenine DNA glycosylase AlkD